MAGVGAAVGVDGVVGLVSAGVEFTAGVVGVAFVATAAAVVAVFSTSTATAGFGSDLFSNTAVGTKLALSTGFGGDVFGFGRVSLFPLLLLLLLPAENADDIAAIRDPTFPTPPT